nr:PREDICTED: tetrapyrrole-binding protein, chloroplastic [Musa acuminata subsp. malaccensis]
MPHLFSLSHLPAFLPSLTTTSPMATSSFQSLHQSFHHHHFTTSPDSIFFKPTKSFKLFFNLSPSSSSSLTTTSASSVVPSTAGAAAAATPFDVLASHLSSSDFRQADEETRRLLIALAGEAAQKRGYVFFSEVQFIPAADLQEIDQLWRRHSGGRFGYGVQRRLWEKSGRDFTRFFIRMGWMKRLDTEVEQYGYRSFPGEFLWELKDDTPEGHLPLTNALRGTQLLRSILTHPAFEESEAEEGGGTGMEEAEEKEKEKEKPKLKGARRSLEPDYSF